MLWCGLVVRSEFARGRRVAGSGQAVDRVLSLSIGDVCSGGFSGRRAVGLGEFALGLAASGQVSFPVGLLAGWRYIVPIGRAAVCVATVCLVRVRSVLLDIKTAGFVPVGFGEWSGCGKCL